MIVRSHLFWSVYLGQDCSLELFSRMISNQNCTQNLIKMGIRSRNDSQWRYDAMTLLMWHQYDVTSLSKNSLFSYFRSFWETSYLFTILCVKFWSANGPENNFINTKWRPNYKYHRTTSQCDLYLEFSIIHFKKKLPLVND